MTTDRELGPLPEPVAWQYWHKVDSLKRATVTQRMDLTLQGADEYVEFPLITHEQARAYAAAEVERAQERFLRGEFICLSCGLRQFRARVDNEGPEPDFQL